MRTGRHRARASRRPTRFHDVPGANEILRKNWNLFGSMLDGRKVAEEIVATLNTL